MNNRRWKHRTNEPRPVGDGKWVGSYTLLDPENFEKPGGTTEALPTREAARARADELGTQETQRLNGGTLASTASLTCPS